jgi:hypothetical protein
MEIMYLWVEDYQSLKDVGFNFSNEFEFDYSPKTGYLSYIIKENSIPKNFYPPKIKTVNAIIGDNGTGKTTLFHFLYTFLANKACKSVIVVKMKDEKGQQIIQPFYEPELEVKLSPENQIYSIVKVPIPYINGNEQALAVEMIKSLHIVYFSLGLHIGDFFGHSYTQDISTTNFIRRTKELLNETVPGIILSDYSDSKLPDYQRYLIHELLMQIDLVNEYPELIRKMFDKQEPLRTLTVYFLTNIINLSKLNVANGYLNGNEYLVEFVREERRKSDSKYGWLNIQNPSLAKVMLGVMILINTEIQEGELAFLGTHSIDKIQDKIKEILLDKYNTAYDFYNAAIQCFEKGSITNIQDIELSSGRFYPDFFSINFEIDAKASKDFILEYIKSKKLQEYLGFYWGLSSGENMYLSIFSRLLFAQKKHKIPNKNIILLLDECEIHLHPKWQREYVNLVLNFAPEIFKEAESFQIMFSSHSPFILSDFPVAKVIFLEKDKDTRKTKVIKLDNSHETFAANVFSLYRESFKVRDGLIGKYSKGKINDVMNSIVNDTYEQIKANEEQYRKLISLIGEPVIKNKILEMLEERLNSNNLND